MSGLQMTPDEREYFAQFSGHRREAFEAWVNVPEDQTKYFYDRTKAIVWVKSQIALEYPGENIHNDKTQWWSDTDYSKHKVSGRVDVKPIEVLDNEIIEDKI